MQSRGCKKRERKRDNEKLFFCRNQTLQEGGEKDKHTNNVFFFFLSRCLSARSLLSHDLIARRKKGISLRVYFPPNEKTRTHLHIMNAFPSPLPKPIIRDINVFFREINIIGCCSPSMRQIRSQKQHLREERRRNKPEKWKKHFFV